jgi:hypothetical protein
MIGIQSNLYNPKFDSYTLINLVYERMNDNKYMIFYDMIIVFKEG